MKKVEFHGIFIKSVEFHKISYFRVTETHETAESTKPYELLLQIGGFWARNHFLAKFSIFAQNTLFRAKRVSREKVIQSAKTHFPAAGGCRNVNFGYVFKL